MITAARRHGHSLQTGAVALWCWPGHHSAKMIREPGKRASRTEEAREGPAPLPFRRGWLVLLAVAAIAAGAALRFVQLDRIPGPVFIDEASLVTPALQLEARLCDFRDAIRPARTAAPSVRLTSPRLPIETLPGTFARCWGPPPV